MIQRGRKSTAKLSVVTTLPGQRPEPPGQRPEPPEQLSDAEAAIWRAVCAAEPANWFTPTHHASLLGYCRVAAFADQLSAEINALRPRPEYDLGELAIMHKLRKGLVSQRDAQHAAIISFARSMRLSHQAQRTAGNAGTEARRAAVAIKKPWE